MTTREDFIMKRVHEHYLEACSLGYEVVGVWLQGSQNYNLDCYDDEYQSDIDTKCIILPNFKSIVEGKVPLSFTHVRANNEHIDIKDIREIVEMFKKQNNSYIEILFTNFYEINPKYKDLVEKLRDKADDIAHLNTNQALRCFLGMIFNKVKDLEHPFPTVRSKIDKFGYDPKQLHHIIRLYDLIQKYIRGMDYNSCLLPTNPDFLLEVKKGKYSLVEARLAAKEYSEKAKLLVESNLKAEEPIKKDVLIFLNDIKVEFIKKFLTEELLRVEVN